MKRLTALCVVLVFTVHPCMAAVRGDKAMYVGGTLTVPEKKQGRLDTAGDTNLVFSWDRGKIEIPFKGIMRLEYGQKAGRRVGAALAVSPVLLFSKKRKHYVTISFTNASGANQGAVFELAKGTVHNVVAVLETRTGKKMEFESEEAKKHFDKEAK